MCLWPVMHEEHEFFGTTLSARVLAGVFSTDATYVCLRFEPGLVLINGALRHVLAGGVFRLSVKRWNVYGASRSPSETSLALEMSPASLLLFVSSIRFELDA